MEEAQFTVSLMMCPQRNGIDMFSSGCTATAFFNFQQYRSKIRSISVFLYLKRTVTQAGV